jgi:tetratricopeptide (TPR) repeat protein
MAQLRRGPEPEIRWQGRRLAISAACALAIQEHRQGHLAAAAEIYELVLAKVPGYAEGHNNRGALLQMLQRYPEALAGYDRAIALKPDYANAYYNRGATLKKLGRPDEALSSYDQAIALKPDHAEAYNNRGVLLQELRRYEDALASYDQVIALQPGHAEAHNNRGIVLVAKGDMPEAERMFLRAAQLKPDFPDPLFNLVNIRRYETADRAEVNAARALLDRPGLAPDGKAQLYFALGKVYDDCGRYDEAFEHFRQANQILNACVAYDAGMIERLTSATIEVFSPVFLSRPYQHASESRTPLFIVGMPRSGTTLLASILSNHSAIGTAGELSTLSDLALQLGQGTGGGTAYPEAIRQLNAEAAARLIGNYEKRLRRGMGPAKLHVIDKNPLNFRHLGLIAMLFPRARIIHCVRNSLDTCLSNYFQRFPLRLDYSFDLRNIGHFYREYARLMEHWRTVPNLKMLEIRYDDMILDNERTTRKMLDFLGLEWDERCLAPHTNPGAVETASHWQVRQPIYRHALERWRHYDKHLGPLRGMLGENDG